MKEPTWGQAFGQFCDLIGFAAMIVVPGIVVVGALGLMGLPIVLTMESWAGASLLCLILLLITKQGR